MFPQSHNQLLYNFVNIVAGLLDGSMLFDVPASIVDLLNLCKADFTPIIATLNDASIVTNSICNDAPCDDSEHMIVAKLLKETNRGELDNSIPYSRKVWREESLVNLRITSNSPN